MTERQGCFGWMEIGRAMPDGDAPWTVWMALLPDGGALYRMLVIADDAVTVTIEQQPCRGAGMRTLHKGRRYLPPKADGDALADSLLATADEAARTILVRTNGTGGSGSSVAVLAEAVSTGGRGGSATGRGQGPAPRARQAVI